MGRPALVISAPTREQLVDEFGELDRLVQQFDPTKKRHEFLKDLIRSWYVDHPAELPATAEGDTYLVQVGARGPERYFSLKSKSRIFTLLGKVRSMELFSITLKAVEEALGKPQLEALASKANTGSRKLVAILKAPADAA